jgi:hypothetical protein
MSGTSKGITASTVVDERLEAISAIGLVVATTHGEHLHEQWFVDEPLRLDRSQHGIPFQLGLQADHRS